MTMAKINKIKAMSRASREDSPWRQWPDEMMKKTALRRLAKLLPAGRDLIEEEESPEPLDAAALADRRAQSRCGGIAGTVCWRNDKPRR